MRIHYDNATRGKIGHCCILAVVAAWLMDPEVTSRIQAFVISQKLKLSQNDEIQRP
jgi:hypothetical protein